MTRTRRNKIICLILSFIFAFSNLSFVQAFAAVKDTKGNFAEKQISKWIEKGYVNAYKDGTFKPNAGMNRADLAKIINRAFGYTIKGKTNFKDVKAKDSFYKDMAIAKSAKYFVAKKNGTIKPKGVINRQEFAYAVYQIMGAPASKTTVLVDGFTDSKLISANFKAGVETVANLGFMSANAENSFRPNGIVTRAEAIEILDKCLSYYRITYNQTGVYSGKTVRGSVSIAATGVTLENTTIRGNLVIDKAVGEGTVNLNNVNVLGDTIINGGGMNSILLENCNITKLIVAKENNSIRIVAGGSTRVKATEMQSGGKLEESDITEAGFLKVVVSNAIPVDAVITLDGDFSNLEVNGNKSDISLLGNGNIENVAITRTAQGSKMSLETGSIINGLRLDSDATITGKGTIEKAEVNVQGSAISVNVKKLVKSSDIVVATPTPTPPPSNDATLKMSSLIKGQVVTSLGTPSGSQETVAPGTIILPYDKAINTTNLTSYITVFDKNEAGATVKAVKYDKSTASTNFLGDAAYGNQIINDQDYFVIGVTAADKMTKKYYKIIVTVKPVQIPSFDTIPNIAAGMLGNLKYGSVSSLASILPTSVKAGNGSITVPVKSWTNTDNINFSKVGSYTFTAVLGTLPAGYTNERGIAPTVEIVITPSGEIYSNSTISYMDVNPSVNIVLLKDVFDSSNTTTSLSYWNVSTGSTGLTWSAVVAGGTSANLYFTGAAKEGSITIQAKNTILVGGVQTNTITIKVPGPTKLTAFDKIPVIHAGIAGNAKYANSTAVIASLPKTVTANATSVTIPVNTWQNTDGYNPNTAGSYTFTASLGNIPVKYVNYYGYTATVEVIVNPPGALTVFSTIPNGVQNPSVQITLANDTFSSECGNLSNWNCNVGNTKLTLSSVTRTGTNNATVTFTGSAAAGSITLQAKNAAMTGGAQTNSISITVLAPTTITGFAPLPNVQGGIAGNAIYQSAASAAGSLPTTIISMPSGATVPVAGWGNTDNYNPAVAGSYTFTAILGAIPAGYANPNGYTSRIEVVVSPPGIISIGSSIPNGTVNPLVQVNLTNDTFSGVGAANPGNWNIGVGSTGLAVGSITASSGSSAVITFNGTANTGTISVQAYPGALNGGVGTNTVSVSVKAPTSIYSFDNLPNRSAGIVGNVIYGDAAAVLATLPNVVTANSGVVTVPVTSWINTDNYNPGVAGSYTFTAVLGAIPAGYSNASGKTAVIEVVVSAPTVITSFNYISDISGGIAGAALYPSAEAVAAALPSAVAANGGTVSIPVVSWTNSGGYNPAAAGSYTFTAVLGTIPSGYVNSSGLTATVRVVIAPPGR